jgi:peroxiredoxin family protein
MEDQPSSTTVRLEQSVVDYIDNAVTTKIVEKLNAVQEQIDHALAQSRNRNVASSAVSNRATIVAFSGDMDRLMAAFIIATGAATMGMEVSVYCTFWALAALKKKTSLKGKPITEKLIAIMLPSGPAHLRTSAMNMLGIGPTFFNYVMKKKKLLSLPDLISVARETGVRIIACQMAMDVMGMSKEELIDGIDYGGVATYLADARDSKVTLFV